MDQKQPMKSAFAAAFTLLLLGCGDRDAGREEALEGAQAESDRVECAVAGAEAFEPVCTVERVTGEDGLTLTIRAPDGSFRRLLVTNDGRGVVAADGASPARVSIVGENSIEVAVEGDRYRLPATVKAPQQPAA